MIITEHIKTSRLIVATWRQLLLLVFLCILTYLFDNYILRDIIQFPSVIPVILGPALAFFIGFNNNQAYDRWWEAWKIWGSLVNNSRTWARQIMYYLVADNIVHDHTHTHDGEHAHIHDHQKTGKDLTPWILFTVFVLGPCEPLIPILMYPAAKSSIGGMFLVTGVFAAATLVTMLSIVLLGTWGIGFANFGKLEKYTHAIAGGTICLSGLAIMLLGL
jgi:ABC-type nickel/cobalt efflux system permease component RcnA